MSEQNIEFVSKPFRPAPLRTDKQQEKRNYTESPKKARGYASVAFFALLIVNIAASTLDFLPEIASMTPLRTAFSQVERLASQLVPGGSGLLQTRVDAIAALIASGVFWVTAYSQLRFSRYPVYILAALTSALVLRLTFPKLPFEWIESSVPFVLGCIIVAYTVTAAVKLPRIAAAPHSTDRRASRWVGLCLLTVLVPIAIGRAICTATIASISGPVAFSALEPNATAAFLYLVGSSAIIAMWGFLQFLPPWPVSRPIWPTVANSGWDDRNGTRSAPR